MPGDVREIFLYKAFVLLEDLFKVMNLFSKLFLAEIHF